MLEAQRLADKDNYMLALDKVNEAEKFETKSVQINYFN